MSYDERLPRLIPEGEVWKYIYDASHAPHYTMQLACGALIGIYSPVENIYGDPSCPFTEGDLEKVRNPEQFDHITVTEHERQNTPFADRAHHDRIIPENRVVLMDLNQDADVLHAVHQLPNGTFITDLQNAKDRDVTPAPMGVTKEQVMEKLNDPDIDTHEISIHQSPFKPRDDL